MPRSNCPIVQTACVCSVVEFKTRDDMERAIRKLDGTELNGRKISLIEVCRFEDVNVYCLFSNIGLFRSPRVRHEFVLI